MNDVKKKYFFFDIDGTLAAGFPIKYIPKSTLRTLRKLEEDGHFLAIATGRSNVMAHSIYEQCGFKNMVSDGGNGLTMDDKLLYIDPIDIDMVRRLAKELDKKNYLWSVSLDNSKVRYTNSKKFFEECDGRYLQTVLDEDLDIDKVDKVYKMYVTISRDEEKYIDALKTTTYSRFRDDFIIVEQTDKSIGIKKMMDILGADYSDVVVFGDEMNDFSMFRDEWTSIAMGNAVERLKEVADFVTKNVDEDGIEYACKYFGWID